MNNFVIFGSTQCGKSTLAGYIVSHTLDDQEFNKAVQQHKKVIEDMDIGEMTKDMVYISFTSLDRDELKKCSRKRNCNTPALNSIGSTKRTHRKMFLMDDKDSRQSQRLIMIDTPGMRSEAKERYMGIFEGDVGICMINILDIESYIACENTDQLRINNYERRLFDPIRFWCAYKKIQNLIIVISKIDNVEFDANRINTAIHIVSEKLREFGLNSQLIPIIPISIRIYMNNENYIREEHNVSEISNNYTPMQPTTLLSMIAQKGRHFYINEHTELFASVSGLYKIKDRRGHAFRIKVLQDVVRMNSKVTIGPLKHIKSNTLCYITGKIKSLKEESEQDTVPYLNAGSIGGIGFSAVHDVEYDSPPLSKMHELVEYKVLKTTVLTSDHYLSGDSITISVPDDELSTSSLLALNQLLPKESVNFFWLGKRIISEIIEIYHSQNKWYITLCPLVNDYKNSIGNFTVPVDQNGSIPKLECLVVLQLLQNGTNKMLSSYRNYVSFTLEAIHNYFIDGQYGIYFSTESEDLEYVADDFEINLANVAPTYTINRMDNERSELIVYNVTYDNIEGVLKAIRGVVRDNGLIGYCLKIKPIDC